MSDTLTYPVGKTIEAMRVGPRDVVLYLQDGGQLIVECWPVNTDGKKGKGHPNPTLTAKLV